MSWAHFAKILIWKIILWKIQFGNRNLNAVGHSSQKIYDIPWSTDGSETPTQKDYGQPTKYRAAGVGARGAYASKNFTFVTIHLYLGIEEPLRPLMEKQIPKLLLK